MQDFDHKPRKTLVTGGSGTGKTTLAEKLMREQKAKLKFVYDHDGQFASRFDHEAIYNATQLDAAVVRAGWIVYYPTTDFDGRELGKNQYADLSMGFQFFCDYVLKLSQVVKGRKLLYCDEVDILTTNTMYPASLVALMQTGRRYQIDCVLISSQPNTLHNRVRTQITEVYSFLHTDANAIKFLSDNGMTEESIRGLGEHGCLYRDLRANANTNAIPKTTGSSKEAGD